jgi:hypothetical protein
MGISERSPTVFGEKRKISESWAAMEAMMMKRREGQTHGQN